MHNKVVNRNQSTARFCVRCAYNTKQVHMVLLQRHYARAQSEKSMKTNIGIRVFGFNHRLHEHHENGGRR